MLKFIFKISWRTVKIFWLYNTINIVGLSIAVAVALFITAIVQFETGYDAFNKNKNSIYRVIEDMHYEGSDYQKGASTPYPLATLLKIKMVKLNYYKLLKVSVRSADSSKSPRFSRAYFFSRTDLSFFGLSDITLQIVTYPFKDTKFHSS